MERFNHKEIEAIKYAMFMIYDRLQESYSSDEEIWKDRSKDKKIIKHYMELVKMTDLWISNYEFISLEYWEKSYKEK